MGDRVHFGTLYARTFEGTSAHFSAATLDLYMLYTRS